MSSKMSVNEIDACLPQTQCGRCGYPYCIDYAAAIYEQKTDINRCPPGGSATITLLAGITTATVSALDPSLPAYNGRMLAVIDESLCIGCTLCIKACPVDAIVGAAKLMHDVLAEQCTGCELCLPPCPMDCILLETWQGDTDNNSPWPEYSQTGRERARIHAKLHRQRLESRNAQGNKTHRDQQQQMRADIAAAVARVRAKRKDF